jgi:TonB-dependent starch-binding outer membrane protein SusC
VYLSGLRTPPEFDQNNFLEPDGTQRRYGTYDNAIWTQEFNKYNLKLNRFVHSSQLSWDAYKGGDLDVALRGQFNIDRYDQISEEKRAVGSASSLNRLGYLGEIPFNSQNTNIDLSANFRYKFTSDISAELVLGSQAVDFEQNYTQTQANTILPFTEALDAAPSQTGISRQFKSRYVGIFGQLTASLFDRLNVTIGLRRDGASTFGEFNQFALFPKAGISYTLSRESFMEGLKGTIDNVKIRASYGESGSPTQPTPYATNSLYTPQGLPASYYSTFSSRLNRSGIVNSVNGGALQDIIPERLIEREVGLEVGFLNNRVNLEFNYYFQSINEMILQFEIPPSTGYNNFLRNAARMTNQGFELGITANVVNINNFSWNASLNYSRVVNRVISTAGRPFISLGGFINAIAKEGEALGIMQGRGWLRDTDGRIVYSGERIVVNNDGNAIRRNGRVLRDGTSLTEDERKNGAAGAVIGVDEINDIANGGALANLIGAPAQDASLIDNLADPNPAFTLGIRNDFRIMKNLSVGILLDGIFGATYYSATPFALQRFGTAGITRDREDAWTNFDGQPVTVRRAATIRGYSFTAGQQANRAVFYRDFQDAFNIDEPAMSDATFFRLRELSISYSFDELKQFGIGTVSVQVVARNLLTFFSKYTGYDPEVTSFGNSSVRGQDWFQVGQVRSVRVGLGVNF